MRSLAALLPAALVLVGPGCSAAPPRHGVRGARGPGRDLALALEVRVARWGEAPAYLLLPRIYPTSKQLFLEEWLGPPSNDSPGAAPREPQQVRPLRVTGRPDPAGEGPPRLRYAARVRLRRGQKLPHLRTWPSVSTDLEPYLVPTSKLPARSPLLRRFLISRVGPKLDAGETDVVRAIIAVLQAHLEVRREFGLGPDVLAGLRSGVTTPIGWSRILVTCLRTAQIPARLAAGVDLDAPSGSRFRRWVEVFALDRWWPLDPLHAPPGLLPSGVIELDHGDLRFLPRSAGTQLRYTLLPVNLEAGQTLGEAAREALDEAARLRAAR